MGCLGVSSELRQREFGWQYCSAPFWNSCFPLIFWGMGCLCGLNLLQLFLPVLRACTARLYREGAQDGEADALSLKPSPPDWELLYGLGQDVPLQISFFIYERDDTFCLYDY